MHGRSLMRVAVFCGLSWICSVATAEDSWVSYPPGQNANGKHIVLVSGDEEYRSEQVLPAFARILATHHGFKCTVLFAVDPKDGTINPNVTTNIPGLQHLD